MEAMNPATTTDAVPEKHKIVLQQANNTKPVPWGNKSYSRWYNGRSVR